MMAAQPCWARTSTASGANWTELSGINGDSIYYGPKKKSSTC